MGLLPGEAAVTAGCARLLDKGLAPDGGIDRFVSVGRSETCVTGFILALVTAFEFESPGTERMLDYLLAEQMPDGG